MKARRLLAQLKEAFTAFNDLSFRYCMDAYEAFLQSDDEILFLHVREPRRSSACAAPLGRPAAPCWYAAPIWPPANMATRPTMESGPMPMTSISTTNPRSIPSPNG